MDKEYADSKKEFMRQKTPPGLMPGGSKI